MLALGALSFLLHVLPRAHLDRSILLLKNASTMLFLIVVAGNLAILQALTGQIYLVVILARLVSLAVATSERE